VTTISSTVPTRELPSRATRIRQLFRVTWLQHRGMFLGLAGLLIVIVVVAILIEMQSHAEYAQFVANHCVANWRYTPCGTISDWFAVSTDGLSALEIAVSAVPVIVGVFVGAPFLSREFETGTFRFTFTQRVGRNRFALITLAIFAVIVAAVGVAAGLLLSWVVHPFEVVGLDNKWQSGFFNATALMLAGWSVFALALGAFLGAWLKRVVSSMAATAILVGGLIVASFLYVLNWVFSIGTSTISGLSPFGVPLGKLGIPASRIPGAPKGGWLIRGWYESSSGRILSSSAAQRIRDKVYGASLKPSDATHWLSLHHLVYVVSYQPANRFWTFQVITAAILIGLAGVFAYLTVRRIRSV
jgi:hypothetical protein